MRFYMRVSFDSDGNLVSGWREGRQRFHMIIMRKSVMVDRYNRAPQSFRDIFFNMGIVRLRPADFGEPTPVDREG